MDLRRSCAEEWVQFYRPVPRPFAADLPDVPGANACLIFGPPNPPLTKIRWYWCEDSALNFPGTIWASALYLDPAEKADTLIGVDPFAGSKWSNGKTPPGAGGQKYCGKLSDFQEPGTYDLYAKPLARQSSGLPNCCTPALGASLVLTTPFYLGWPKLALTGTQKTPSLVLTTTTLAANFGSLVLHASNIRSFETYLNLTVMPTLTLTWYPTFYPAPFVDFPLTSLYLGNPIALGIWQWPSVIIPGEDFMKVEYDFLTDRFSLLMQKTDPVSGDVWYAAYPTLSDFPLPPSVLFGGPVNVLFNGGLSLDRSFFYATSWS